MSSLPVPAELHELEQTGARTVQIGPQSNYDTDRLANAVRSWAKRKGLLVRCRSLHVPDNPSVRILAVRLFDPGEEYVE